MQQRQTARSNRSRGIALITVLLLLLILSAAAVALMYTVNTEAHLQKTDQGNGMAYYAAEAGMEKMMTDLSNLYNISPFPSVTAIQNVGGLSNIPPATDLNGAGFTQYQIVVPTDANGNPSYFSTTVHGGSNDGLLANVLALTLNTTAVRPGGGEQVAMTRQVEVALIPVFQFGVFSQGDLDFFAGPNFVFGGRVHTNGNLFLAQGHNGPSLTFLDKVHASYDVVRDTMMNGVSVTAGGGGDHSLPVFIPTGPSGCPTAGATATTASCRALTFTSPDEGSSVNGTLRPPGIPTAGGTNNAAIFGPLSTTTYTQGFLQANVPQLNLPFVKPGVDPIEIIRQPQPTDNQAITASRLYNKAQIWVLLADTAAELPGGAGDAQNIRISTYTGYPSPTTGLIAAPKGGAQTGDSSQTVPFNTTSPAAIDGWIRVEYSTGPGNAHVAATTQWLAKGISRDQNFPDSENGVSNCIANTSTNKPILYFQQLDDSVGCGGPFTAASFIPINLYDAREGEPRDDDGGLCYIGGVFNVIDIDVKNLSAWIAATPAIDAVSQNGYGLYFSDRRGMVVNPATGTKNGDYGFTDVINESDTNGLPNGTLDQGEIANVDGSLEIFGGGNLGKGTNTGNPLANPITTVNCTTARKSWISGARHAVRLINGSGTNLPARTNPDPTNIAGFTLASENPVYVRANYNATTALGFTGNHGSAAVVADTVNLQSGSWTDQNSFANPTHRPNRPASTSYFRLAIASGKNKAFSKAATAGTASNDYGTDGGMHNFLRLMEDWGGQTLNYQGSMVSLYYSHYATGVFKCCNIVYGAPQRQFAYDTDFQTMNKMPPLTPTFEQVVNMGYAQNFAHQ